MRISKQLIITTGLLLWGSLTCNAVFAQARVVEAESSNSQPQFQQQSQQQSQAPVSSGQNEVMVDMYLQLEALQNEIQNLRGLVEEQSYQIRRMQTEQRDRYLDTDSRISELYNQSQSATGGPGQGIAVQRPTDAVGNQNTTTPGASISQPATNTSQSPASRGASAGAAIAAASPQNEQELYRQALGLLLEDAEYEDAITLFQQYIHVYPNGRYFTNALYWQGAALDLVARYNQSINVLQRLIQEYPSDPKAPTAMLRLGTVYRQMGNIALATENWRKISELYPDSASEIGLANEYLAEISN